MEAGLQFTLRADLVSSFWICQAKRTISFGDFDLAKAQIQSKATLWSYYKS